MNLKMNRSLQVARILRLRLRLRLIHPHPCHGPQVPGFAAHSFVRSFVSSGSGSFVSSSQFSSVFIHASYYLTRASFSLGFSPFFHFSFPLNSSSSPSSQILPFLVLPLLSLALIVHRSSFTPSSVSGPSSPPPHPHTAQLGIGCNSSLFRSLCVSGYIWAFVSYSGFVFCCIWCILVLYCTVLEESHLIQVEERELREVYGSVMPVRVSLSHWQSPRSLNPASPSSKSSHHGFDQH